MSQQRQDEKAEKAEKPEEKQEEKGRGEKWQRDPVGSVVWAAILIWAGVVLLAATLNVLGRFANVDAAPLIFIGAGVLVIIGALYRLAVPAYRQPVAGSLILGVILIAIGLGSVIGWGVVGPLALIAIGAYLLLRAVFGQR